MVETVETKDYNDIDFLKESSYIFPDFVDINATIDGIEKTLFPLDYLALIDSHENQKILDAILSEIPFYHVSPKTVLFNGDIDELNNLSESRDSGIVNVPSIMQTSDFYQVWFREAWGYLYNKLILDIFNKLRYPFISEHQYLMIDTMSTLIEKTFEGNPDTELTLNEDYSYINDIVEDKINSTTSLLDITFNNNEFLDNVIESMYYGGLLSSEEKETERYIFLLQEIRNELLKRKLAGTFTMYKMAIASLGRNGSFVNACKIKDLETINRQDISKNTERYFRYVNILGLTTKKIDKNEYFDVTEIYPDIPQKLLSEIFFSSNEDDYFSATTVEKKNTFLRDNVSIVKWNTLESVVSQENIIDKPDYLDMLSEKTNLTITLDEFAIKDANDDTIVRYLDHTTAKTAFSNLLSANILDLSADKLLYHDYTKTSGIDKSLYLTYSIANGNGISLMDTFWLDYIENSLKGKTKVTDNTLYGVQVSKYVDLSESYASKNFFGYEKRKVENKDNIYLYYCIINYDTKTYTVSSIDKKLITKITKNDDGYYEGVIPFTYSEYVDDAVKSTDSETIKFKGYNKCYFAFSESDITKNILPSGDPKKYKDTKRVICLELPSKIKSIYYIISRVSDEATTDGKVNLDYFWSEPISVIDLGEEESSWFSIDNLKNKHFSPDWKGLAFYLNPYLNFTKESASPLRHKNVFTTDILEDNRTKDNAKISTGASENTILCNLTRMRELDYWANDNDSTEQPIWSEILEDNDFSTLIDDTKLGLYLQKENSIKNNTIPKGKANAVIYGDNRKLDILDIRCIQNSKGKKYNYSTLEKKKASGNQEVGELFSNPDDTTVYSIDYGNNLVKYYIYNITTSLFEELIEDDIKEISSNYLDSTFKDYCISIQKDDFALEGSTEETSSEEVNIQNYLYITSTTKNSEKDCYWDGSLYDNQTEWGRTICMNIHVDENNIEKDKKYVLVSQLESEESKNYSLILYKNNDNKFKFKFTWYPTREYEEVLCWFIESDSIQSLGQNLRVSASIYFVSANHTGNKEDDDKNFVDTYLSIMVNDDLKSVSFRFSKNDKDYNYYTVNSEETISATSSFAGGNISQKQNSDYFKNLNKLLPIKQAPIYIGYDSTNTTFMDIFDLRLYNEGKSPEELRLLNMGTMYELYSYSPCAYNLAHNLYSDMGIFKVVNTTDTDNSNPINLIRVFNRGVWDSILIDNFPVTDAEKQDGPQKKISYQDPLNDTDIYLYNEAKTTFALNDCIEQELFKDVETYSNTYLSENVDLEYNNSKIEISTTQALDIVLSTISPSVGNSVSLGHTIYLDTNLREKTLSCSKGIDIPVDTSSSDDYFSYKADLYPTFTLDNSISLDSWLTRGNNITVTYDESNNCNLVTLADTSIKDSERNSAVYPLYVSDGEKVDFKIKNYKLSNTLCQLLKATSYYTEVCIPVPCKTKNEVYTEADITNLVGENIPCYYTAENLASKATTDVFQSGVTYYTTEDGNIFTAASIYSDDVIPAYFINSGEGYTQCEGKDKFTEGTTYFTKSIQYNPTYHYKWDGIRLLKSGTYKVTCKYPMRIRHFNPSNADDSSTTTFYGTLSFNIKVEITPKNNTKVASNFTANILPSRKEYYKDNLGNHITYVDPQRDNNSLTYHFPHADVVITVECNDNDITPTTDGFVGTGTHLRLNKLYKSADIIDNFTINIGDTENLNGSNSITLNKDTAYELFIDYDGCVTELSLDGYNILENVNTTDYSNFMYTKDISDNLNIDSTKNSGFEVDNNGLKNKSDDNLTFGDYKEITSSENALYSLLVDSSYNKQWDVDNSYPIYYLDTISTGIYNVSSTIYSETTFVSPAILDEIVAFTDSDGAFEKTDLTEESILKDIYDELNIGNSLLRISNNSSMGLLSGLSGLMVKSGENKSIELEDYNLYAYKKPALEFNNSGNTEEQSYSSKDSNNLFGKDAYSFIKDGWTIDNGNSSQDIKIDDFDNNRHLKIKKPNKLITIKSKENVFSKFGLFTVSLEATGISRVSVKLINYTSSTFENEEKIIDIISPSTDDTNVWSNSSTKSLLVNKVEITITPNSNEDIVIKNLSIVCKGSSITDTTNGIYNGYSKNNYSNIYLPSYEVAILEDKDNLGKYIPVQFKSSVIVGNDGYSRPNFGATKSMLFITNNSYRDYENNSSIKGLINPWKKQLCYTHSIYNDINSVFHIYSYTKDSKGYESVISIDNTDVYSFEKNGISLNNQNDVYNINISALKYDFTKYSSNLKFAGTTLKDDTINYVYNCFNINNYLNSDKSNVVVTNIQFLNKDSDSRKTILYELEYLPIIYDEKKHHLSINLMLKKN